MPERFRAIFTDDEMKRICMPSVNEISVDVHHLTVKETKKLLKNLIALDLEGFNLTVIHGYNRGTSLKEMLWNDFDNPRIIEKQHVWDNPGQTLLSIARVA